MHLNSDQLVDIAEGTRPESSAPHLAGCEACRAQLHELRAMMSAASEAEVPEPSPLFWDHLSSRVREAVATERTQPAPSRSTFGEWLRSRAGQVTLLVAATLLLAVALNQPATAPAPIASPATVTVADAAPVIELLSDVAANDDASLTLVASLTDAVDLDTVREAGLAPAGSAEHAVTHMTDVELRELRRMLKEEMTRSGA